MADPKVAMRESGYVVGGISPLGQRTHHKTVLDESALQYDEILLSGGKRGFSVGVNPNDLLKVLDAVAAPIALGKKHADTSHQYISGWSEQHDVPTTHLHKRKVRAICAVPQEARNACSP